VEARRGRPDFGEELREVHDHSLRPQQEYEFLAGGGDGGPACSPEVLAGLGTFLGKFTADLAAYGELVDARGLTAPALGRRVQLRDGASVVTDGSFSETEEVFAGYWIVECAGIDQATEIAARLNDRSASPSSPAASLSSRPARPPRSSSRSATTASRTPSATPRPRSRRASSPAAASP
jgi:hypothetical protein